MLIFRKSSQSNIALPITELAKTPLSNRYRYRSVWEASGSEWASENPIGWCGFSYDYHTSNKCAKSPSFLIVDLVTYQLFVGSACLLSRGPPQESSPLGRRMVKIKMGQGTLSSANGKVVVPAGVSFQTRIDVSRARMVSNSPVHSRHWRSNRYCLVWIGNTSLGDWGDKKGQTLTEDLQAASQSSRRANCLKVNARDCQSLLSLFDAASSKHG